MKPEGLTIIANGEQKRLASPCSVADFVASCGFKTTQVVVEYNAKVLDRTQLDKVQLREGDRLEVIVPVAGG
jgi:thiamine biosynthesis protein ThiS